MQRHLKRELNTAQKVHCLLTISLLCNKLLKRNLRIVEKLLNFVRFSAELCRNSLADRTNFSAWGLRSTCATLFA